MSSKNDKILLLGLAIIAVLVLIFATNENSLVFLFFNQYAPVVWDDVLERNIVRSSIPIEILDMENGSCTVSAKNFDKIVDHQYFARADDIIKELKYDRNNETLSLPCGILEEDKSRLNVWFVVEESTKHSNKYEYFVTSWEETSTEDTTSSES